MVYPVWQSRCTQEAAIGAGTCHAGHHQGLTHAHNNVPAGWAAVCLVTKNIPDPGKFVITAVAQGLSAAADHRGRGESFDHLLRLPCI